MKRKVTGLAFVLSLLLLALVGLVVFEPVKANAIYPAESLPVNRAYIRNNGTVDPQTLPIQRQGNLYFLTDNIIDYVIEVQKDNIVLDGKDYSMLIPRYGEKDAQGQTKTVPSTIDIADRTNVSVKNFYFRNIGIAISVLNSSFITIAQNTVINCRWIYLHSCSHCLVEKNILTNNYHGLLVVDLHSMDIRYNLISGSAWHSVTGDIADSNIIGNTFKENIGYGLCQIHSNNRIIGNIFQENDGGVLSYYENNEIHHNNFIKNRNDDVAINAPNILDDGKEGNYWSNPHSGSRYIIPSIFMRDNETNVDNHPRSTRYVFDYQPPSISIVSPENDSFVAGNVSLTFAASKQISRSAYSVNGNEKIVFENGTSINGLGNGTYTLTIYAEDSFGNEGIDEVTFDVQYTVLTYIKSEGFDFTLALETLAIVAVSVAVGGALILYFKKFKKKADRT